MEENASPALSLAPEPEQSQDRMDSCSQGTLNELLFPHNKRVGNVLIIHIVVLGSMIF